MIRYPKNAKYVVILQRIGREDYALVAAIRRGQIVRSYGQTSTIYDRDRYLELAVIQRNAIEKASIAT